MIDVSPTRIVETFDLEWESQPANYSTKGGLICHNSYGFNKSHATAYGMIAYWGMYLKTYFPVEFYWALLVNEPDKIKIQKIVKDAKKRGIEVLPPDVSESRDGFSITAANAIRGSLVDIKNVGDGAAKAIMASQPYESFDDFLERIDGKRVNKRVVENLLKAGALDPVIPNVKWLIEHFDPWWEAFKRAGSKDKALDILSRTRGKPDYSKEERTLIASSVSPLAFGKHPIDAYSDFMANNVGVPIAAMSDEEFFKAHHNKSCYIAGVIVETKYNQVGDFHTGAALDEREKMRMGWGKRYANVNVEDVGGKQNRVKVDFDIFDDYRDIVDSGIGTPVVLHVFANAKYENLRAHFLINLEKYRRKISADEPLTVWERIISGAGPVVDHAWETGLERKAGVESVSGFWKKYNDARIESKKARVTASVVGVITHRKEKPDKNHNNMGFFGLIGGDGAYVDILCFSSSWGSISKHISPGRMVKIDLTLKDGTAFFEGGRLKLFRDALDAPNPAPASAA